MPPWTAEIGHGDFLGERRLTERRSHCWKRGRRPRRRGACRRSAAAAAIRFGLAVGQAELSNCWLPAPFTVPADGPDIFQHFIIPLNLDENKTIVGFEFRPGNAAVVHHAILFLDTMGVGRKRDAETPEPGYRTSGSIGIPVAGIVGVWTPGMTPRFFPQDIGLPVRKGADLVVQLHMHPSGKEETDQSSIALYFADKPVERTMAGSPLVVGSLMIDIPPGARDYTVESSVTLADRRHVDLAVAPHASGGQGNETHGDSARRRRQIVGVDQGLEFLLAEQLHVSRAGAAARRDATRYRQPL